VLIAENQSADAIAAAVGDYVARRLVERERALAADWRVDRTPQPPSRPGASAPPSGRSANPTDTSSPDRFSRRATGIGGAISESVLSDSNGLRRHVKCYNFYCNFKVLR
jgi:hypothetical protein